MTGTITLPRSVVEQALEALNASMPYNNDMDEDWPSHIAARRALRAALEQPQVEQEPVAWIFQHDETGWITYVDAQKVKTGFEKGNPRWQKICPVYLNPQPPRQPLTDEQILNFGPGQPDAVWTYEDQLYFARAIERTHGIGGEA